jgi:hypothetical protein
MPRNGSGVYSLPAGNPVVTGTQISSTTHNNTNTDMANALTQSLSADGQTPMTGPQLLFAGSTVPTPASGDNTQKVANTAFVTNVTTLGGLVTVNGGQVAGVRNLLINGALSIDQRNSGAAQTIVNGAAAAYTADRFFASVVGANCTGQRIFDATNNKYRYQLNGVASITSMVFGQRVESQNTYKFVGKTLALSAEIANSTIGTVTWVASYANATDNFSAVTQIATGTFTGVTSTPTKYSASFVVPANGVNGIQIHFSSANQTSGLMSFAELQLEVTDATTPHATTFEQSDPTSIMVRCQRYLPTWNLSGYTYSGQCFNANEGRVALPLRVNSRVPITSISLSSGTLGYSQASGAVTGTAQFFFASTDTLVTYLNNTGAGLIAGNGTLLAASGALTLFGLGCEL